MKIIAPSVNKEGLETEEKFGDIEFQQDHSVENKSPDLRPRFHLKALEKGVFKGAASTEVDCPLKSLRDQKEQVENQNKDIKANSSAKQKAKGCQKALNHLRKHHEHLKTKKPHN